MELVKRKKETKKPEVTIATVVFDNGYREYGYKTILPVKVGDSVVVEVGINKTLKIVKVIAINVKKEKHIKYKWIIGIVDKDSMLDSHVKALETYGIKE